MDQGRLDELPVTRSQPLRRKASVIEVVHCMLRERLTCVEFGSDFGDVRRPARYTEETLFLHTPVHEVFDAAGH